MDVEPWVRHAIDEGLPPSQLELHFQPVVRLNADGIHGAETFLRWRHPTRGLISPKHWLPYAVGSGAAVALSTAALPVWASCAKRMVGLVLSFNTTGQDLADDGYMAQLLALAPEHPVGLALEVPHLQFHAGEARLAAPQWDWMELADLEDRLARLRAAGLSVWLDDFGDATDDETAAIGRNVDVVKLDRTLLGWPPLRLSSLVERLHEHGKVVIIEGVESEAHERRAREAGIELASGFHYAPPLTEEQFTAYRR
jgi:diguanylate cyclase